MIKVTRKTTESEIILRLDSNKLPTDYRSRIETTIPFLNHMIEHIAWRLGMGIEVNVALDKFVLAHLICEDVGMALGKAVAEHMATGDCKGYGDAIGIIDEARAMTAISFESRAMFIADGYNIVPPCTEGMNSEDLKTFLEGFAHGASATLQIDIQRGENGHHIWEAVYRSVGEALSVACRPDPNRAGLTSGVAGVISYVVE